MNWIAKDCTGCGKRTYTANPVLQAWSCPYCSYIIEDNRITITNNRSNFISQLPELLLPDDFDNPNRCKVK